MVPSLATLQDVWDGEGISVNRFIHTRNGLFQLKPPNFMAKATMQQFCIVLIAEGFLKSYSLKGHPPHMCA